MDTSQSDPRHAVSDRSDPSGSQLPLTALARAISDRVASEAAAREKLEAFAGELYEAIESLVPELTAAGLDVTARRAEVEESHRLELKEARLNDRLLFMTQPAVAYVLEHSGAHGALYAFIVSDTSSAFPVERFLVSKNGEVHCEGVCAPLEDVDIRAIARRLLEAMWIQAKSYWTPLDALNPMPLADVELPRLKGQMGFKPRTTLLPPPSVRSSR